MADMVDLAQERIEMLSKFVKTSYEIPKGVEGDCEMCGYFKKRLINGCCGKCRDEFKLP